VPLDQAEELSNLIRLRLPADLLKIDDLRDLRMRENVMAPRDSHEAEAECLDESPDVLEPCVAWRRPELPQEFSLAGQVSDPES
jgi:hypothetical protein